MAYKQKGWSPFTKVNPIQPVELKIKGSEGKSRRKADDPELALNMHPDAPFVKKSPMKFVSFSYSSRTSSGPEPKEEKSSSGIKEQVYGTVDSKSAFNKNGKTDPPTGQDVVKSVKDQIKDLEQDIVKLKSRNNPGDRKRIQKLTQEIKRLKSK